MQLTQYEPDKLMFIDTEFKRLEQATAEILSRVSIKLNGEELYLELDYSGAGDPWVKRHILPTLTAPKVTVKEACRQIRDFLGPKMPFAVAYVDNYDSLYFVKMFGAGKLPFKWMTIEFSSILFANGINPTKFLATESGAKTFYKSLGIDLTKYKQHHSLDDARLVRDVWLKVIKSDKNP